MATNDKDPSEKALLIEYQKAQDSAEHSDRLLWIVTGMFYATILILVVGVLTVTKDLMPLIKSMPITYLISYIIGMSAFSLLFFSIADNGRYRKEMAYYRCKKIEIKLHMEHHLLSDMRYQKSEELTKPDPPMITHFQTITVVVILATVSLIIFFISLWIT